MRILISSDLHGSLPALRFLAGAGDEIKPDMLVLLGDLVYHGPRNPLPQGYDTGAMLSVFPELLQFPWPIIAVRGNCDAEVDVVHMPFPMPENSWLAVDGLKIFVCHGHHLPEHPPLADMPLGTIVLRGHTHIPRAETEAGIHFWNPGSLSLPKGGYPPSYAIYEDRVFRVMDLNGNEIMRQQINAIQTECRN